MSLNNISVNHIPSEMRALVLAGQGFEHLELRTIPTPQPGPQQLLARVDAAGICTSLIKLIEQGSAHSLLYGLDIHRYPLILGDEGSVTIVQVGEALAQHYQAGQRFVVQPAVDHAPITHRERFASVESIFKLGVGYSLPGHLAEYMLIGEEILAAGCLVPVPDTTMPYAHAAMSEPLSCVVSAQDHHLHLEQYHPRQPRSMYKGIKAGGVTLIIGAGAMGRMHVDLALSYRPHAIIVSDLLEARLAKTRELFAKRADSLAVKLITVQDSQVLEHTLNEVSQHRGADDVIVAVGIASIAENAQRFVARGGVLNLFGGYKQGQEQLCVNGNHIHYQEINITGSSGGSPWDVARTLELMHSGEINTATHINRIGDLMQAKGLLNMVKAQKLEGKAVVYPHRRAEGILAVPQWTAEDERAYLAAS